MLTKCLPHHLAAPLWHNALSCAAAHEGGVERVAEFIFTRIDDVNAMIACFDSHESVADMLLLGGMVYHLVGTTDSRDVKNWALSVMHSYNLHWFSRICAAVLARPRTSAERERDLHCLYEQAVRIAGRLMEAFGNFDIKGQVEFFKDLARLAMPNAALPVVVPPFHLPRFDPRWLHASQQ